MYSEKFLTGKVWQIFGGKIFPPNLCPKYWRQIFWLENYWKSSLLAECEFLFEFSPILGLCTSWGKLNSREVLNPSSLVMVVCSVEFESSYLGGRFCQTLFISRSLHRKQNALETEDKKEKKTNGREKR